MVSGIGFKLLISKIMDSIICLQVDISIKVNFWEIIWSFWEVELQIIVKIRELLLIFMIVKVVNGARLILLIDIDIAWLLLIIKCLYTEGLNLSFLINL
jgi:hypothetical protein